MSDSHAKLPKLFWIQLALAATIGIIFLIMPSKQNGNEHAAADDKVKAVADNLAPIGAAAVADNKAEAGAADKGRSGEDVYKASCLACHATGVANAPKLDDKAAWEPRVATGFDALLKTAINGKGAMPPRGGNATITDAEIKSTVIYMTTKAGFNLKSDEQAQGVSTATEKEPVAKVEEKTAPANVISEDSSVAEITTPIVAAEIIPSMPSAPIAPIAPTLSKAEPEAGAASTETPKVEAVVSVNVAASAPSPSKNDQGKKTYNSACLACHATGVANAPKLGDKVAWAPRIATGNDALYQVALTGKGAMPAKGGNTSLSDDAVKAAVDYMIANSQ